MKDFNHITSHVYWLALRFAKQLGLLGLAGLGLFLCSLIFLGVKYFPSKQTLAFAQEQLIKIQLENKTLPIAKVESPQDSKAEFSDFYASFPNKSQLSKALKVIQQTATKHKLALNRGDYKITLSNAQSAGIKDIERYEIQLPMSGTYTQMRVFVDEIMQQLPTLALTDLQFKRESIANSTVEARLIFTYFLKGGA